MITSQSITPSSHSTHRNLGLPAEFERQLLLCSTSLGVVNRQVPDQVPLVAEGAAALGALVALLVGLRRDVIGVVVEVDVPLQELFLAEGLVTVLADEGFLVGVD